MSNNEISGSQVIYLNNIEKMIMESIYIQNNIKSSTLEQYAIYISDFSLVDSYSAFTFSNVSFINSNFSFIYVKAIQI